MHLLLFLSPDWLTFCHVIISHKFTRFFIYFLFLSDKGPMLETLDHTIRIASTPTFLYFDLYLYSAYAAHYVYFNNPLAEVCSLWVLSSLAVVFYVVFTLYFYSPGASYEADCDCCSKCGEANRCGSDSWSLVSNADVLWMKRFYFSNQWLVCILNHRGCLDLWVAVTSAGQL